MTSSRSGRQSDGGAWPAAERARNQSPIRTLHATARAELSEWEPADPAQLAERAAYLALLDARPDGVWRSCLPAHVTASAIVLDPTGTRTVLVFHRKIDAWVQPGGHCERQDDSLAAAALREAREETGIADLTPIPSPVLLSRHGAPCGAEWHYDVQFAMVAPADARPTVSEESRDVAWFGVDELPTRLADGVPASVRAGLLGLPA